MRGIMTTTTYLLQTAVSVAVVLAMGALAAFVLRRSQAPERRGPLERIAALPLDARRAIYLVGIGDQVIVVGASEGGLTKLGEMPRDQVPMTEAPKTSFGDLLLRLKGARS